MKPMSFRSTLLLITLSLILSGCSSAASHQKNSASENDFSTVEHTNATEKQSFAPPNNTQTGSKAVNFTGAIQLYDAESVRVLAYSPYLTIQQQCFKINFSLPADKQSVEEAISENIMNLWHGEYIEPVKPDLDFFWKDDMTLILKADNLTTNSYCISLEGSKDAAGKFEIGKGYLIDSEGVHYDMLNFVVHNPQKVFIFDPCTHACNEIPIDSRYYFAYGNLSPSGKTVLIGRITNSFESVHYMPSFLNLETNELIHPNTHSFIDISGNWVGEKLLLYNMLLDPHTGSCSTVFDTQVLSSLMLRDGRYISLTAVNDSVNLILTLYKPDGSKIYSRELPDCCSIKIWECFFHRPVLYELADGDILSTFFDRKNNRYNVFKLNINESEAPAELLHENSFIAAVSPDAKSYALYISPEKGFLSSKVEIYSQQKLLNTITDKELAKNMCLFWQGSRLYVCNSGYSEHFYIHSIDTVSKEVKTIRPKITDNILGVAGITPEGKIVLIESHYNMALFR